MAQHSFILICRGQTNEDITCGAGCENIGHGLVRLQRGLPPGKSNSTQSCPAFRRASTVSKTALVQAGDDLM